MGIGETLRRIIGKMVCTGTRLDLVGQCRGSSVELKVQFMQCVVL